MANPRRCSRSPSCLACRSGSREVLSHCSFAAPGTFRGQRDGVAHDDRSIRVRVRHSARGGAQPRRCPAVAMVLRGRGAHRGVGECRLALSDGIRVAFVLRFLTGCALAGVYPPAMKMASTWFRARRGLAIGTVVGALTVGKATPYSVHALPNAGAPDRVFFTASAARGRRPAGSNLLRRRPVSVPAATILVGIGAKRSSQDASGDWRPADISGNVRALSYWTWIPLFIAASVAGRRSGGIHR